MNIAARFVTPALAMAALGLLAAPAHATFGPETCPDNGCPGDLKFFNEDANKDVTSFAGSVGAEHGGLPVTVETFVGTDTGAGYATIKPHTAGTLDDLLFTPGNPLAFDDFSFRGEVERAGFSPVITVIVTGCLDVAGACVEEPAQTFTLTSDATPDKDFSRLAIASTDGETIFSVEVKTAPGAFFNEFKQVNFSLAPGIPPPVPEPASWAMMLIGFSGVGAALRSRRRLSAAAL